MDKKTKDRLAEGTSAALSKMTTEIIRLADECGVDRDQLITHCADTFTMMVTIGTFKAYDLSTEDAPNGKG